MKKFIKNNILGFILGALIFGSIGVYAYNYKATDVKYTPEDHDWDVSNVQEAINDLKKIKHLHLKMLNILQIKVPFHQIDPHQLK